jgi:hypothetical protein
MEPSERWKSSPVRENLNDMAKENYKLSRSKTNKFP